MKQEGDGETTSSADEETKTLGRVGEMDQPIEYTIHFTKAVELYQQKTEVVSGVEVLTTSCGTAQRILAKQHEKQI